MAADFSIMMKIADWLSSEDGIYYFTEDSRFAIYWRQQICYALSQYQFGSDITSASFAFNWSGRRGATLTGAARRYACCVWERTSVDLFWRHYQTASDLDSIYWRQPICYLLKTANMLYLLKTANLPSTDDSRFCCLVKIADWLYSEMKTGNLLFYWRQQISYLLKTADMLPAEDSRFAMLSTDNINPLITSDLLSSEDSRFAIYWRQQICYLLETADLLSTGDSRFAIYWWHQICMYWRKQICYLLMTADLLSTDYSRFAIYWLQQICYPLKTVVDFLFTEVRTYSSFPLHSI